MWWLSQVITSLDGQSLRNDFIEEGEQYYWVHVRIDRFTDQVLDKRLEVVNE